ncbi:thioredoxin-domain-containing protein [Myriangium duriaei CBS 260.36]|uniref:protein disulfide-isomerase n=1 Tax=Myriangium duriaei CBS 260.36 TaxID=1168546 RepID=A0A9P4J379_9PEZI|nr:thioredoxin-domain-containing protein [Myriangium duriaei CBS 260.36]
MVRTSISAVGVAAMLLPFCAADLYARNSPVIQLDHKKYLSDIAASNHTSIVEFYAPWCGHCKNLQPAYEKAARSLAGLAKVAAVNCDEESNKAFCGSMGVQGFPTLKIVKPGKKAGRPFVEDYQGPRTAKDIVGAVKDKITNHVKRLQDSTIDAWVDEDKDKPKAILFTDKGTTSALIKALAIDFLGGISIGQVRDKEKATCEKYGVTKFPSLVLLPAGGAEPITFRGLKMEKPLLYNFLSQAATPNPDPAPKKVKTKSSSTKKAKAASDSSKLSKASAAHRSEDSSSSAATQTSETVISPEDSPNPIVEGQKPINLNDAEPAINFISPIFNDDMLRTSCLTRLSGTCILLVNPIDPPEEENVKSMLALTSLTKIYNRLAARGKTFKFFNVVDAPSVKTQLGIEKELAILAINAKKGWIKRLPLSGGESASPGSLEDWVDALRMGEGKKETLPEGLVSDEVPKPEEAAPAQPQAEQSPETAASEGVAEEAKPTAATDEAQEKEFDDLLKEMGKEFEASAGQKKEGHDEL